jgi:acetyltransferase-like isoleucine patch superfamily enzyme
MLQILRRIRMACRNFMLKRYSPKMMYSFFKKDGKVVYGSSVSNSTYIDYPQNLTVGERVYIGHHNFIEASHGIRIGDGCQITNFVSITTHSSHDSIRLYGKNYAGSEMIGYLKGSIEIGKFSFIGPHSTLMPGTKLGKGCLVAAYSYVQGEFPDFSILAGNPAKVIGDTRTRDQVTLDKHPELNQYYHAWAND